MGALLGLEFEEGGEGLPAVKTSNPSMSLFSTGGGDELMNYQPKRCITLSSAALRRLTLHLLHYSTLLLLLQQGGEGRFCS